MKGNIRILYSEQQIRKRIRSLAGEIAADYKGSPLLIVGLLNGSFIFLADLVRQLYASEIPLILDFMRISSYGSNTVSSGKPTVCQDIHVNVKNRHVLIVDDILDTGNTLKFVLTYLHALGPASLKTCVCLDKPSRREQDIRADYTGFQVSDTFVVGYGLDYDDRFREMPFIATLPAE